MIEDKQCNKKQQWSKFTRLTRLEWVFFLTNMLKSTKCKFFLVTDYHFDALVRRSLIYDIVFDSRSCCFWLDGWLSGRELQRLWLFNTKTGKKRKKKQKNKKRLRHTAGVSESSRILLKKKSKKDFWPFLQTLSLRLRSHFKQNLPGLFEMVPTSGLYITAVRQRPPAQTCKS